jgi:UDP-N-acetylmuramoylalanine--D-glutamate ligase
MDLKNLENKKICILGYGIENKALVNFLIKKKINCSIIICDAKKDLEYNPRTKTPKISLNTGKNYDKNLGQYDIIFRVAGYPLFSDSLKKAKQSKTIIYDATKLFFDLCPSKKIIGISGTKGKGTVSSLIYKIIKDSGKKVYLGGNIGIAMFSFLDKIRPNNYVVLELSSFQLEDLKKSPHIAVLTNFYKEHLAPADPNNPNYHKSLSAYRKAKNNIFAYQKKEDFLIYNEKINLKNWLKGKGKKISFKKSNLKSKLIGDYNKENIGAAEATAKILKIKKEGYIKSIKNFKGLEHRMEYVACVNGASYYDNSFATTPDSTIMDIDIFNSLILIAGGADKGANFEKLAKKINSKVKFLILLDGKGTKKIIKELNKINFPKNKRRTVKSMKEAIKTANLYSQKGDTILLSTACASFGMFKNYKERGDLFKKEVLCFKK